VFEEFKGSKVQLPAAFKVQGFNCLRSSIVQLPAAFKIEGSWFLGFGF
jgi:hypothetical protein